MNNQGILDAPIFNPFHFVQHINVRICISRKMHFMQRIVYLFGPEILGEILASHEPIILPLINYHTSFDVHVFILL